MDLGAGMHRIYIICGCPIAHLEDVGSGKVSAEYARGCEWRNEGSVDITLLEKGTQEGKCAMMGKCAVHTQEDPVNYCC